MKISIALRGAILALVILPASAALAQGNTLPREITNPRGALSDGQRAQVEQFVDTWMKQLVTPMADPNARQSIDQARRALAGPQTLTAPGGLSPHFRTVYSDALMPLLQRAIAGDDDRAAVEALHIAAKLGTDASMTLVTNVIEDANPHRRAAAAARARLGVIDFQTGGSRTMVAPAIITTLARKVGQVAMNETEAYALQRHIELLNSIQAAAQAQQIAALADDVEAIRKDLLDQRADKLGNSEVDAIIVLLDTLRDHYQFTPETQQQDGPELAASIRKLLAAASRNWDAAQNETSVREAYERLIADSESFLSFIDKTTRRAQQPPTPNTQLAEHWDRRDKPQFDQDLEEWDALLSNAPYNGGPGGL